MVGHYDAGYFAVIARRLGGDVLYGFFAVGAQFSNVGYHSSQMVAAQRTLYYIVEEHWAFEPEKCAALPRYLRTPPADGVARVYVLACAGASLGLAFVPWKALLQVEIALFSVSKMFFIASFLFLRVKKPKARRPFAIPGGFVGAALVAAGPSLVVGANVVLTFFGDWLDPAAPVPPFPGFNLALCAGLAAAVFAATTLLKPR